MDFQQYRIRDKISYIGPLLKIHFDFWNQPNSRYLDFEANQHLVSDGSGTRKTRVSGITRSVTIFMVHVVAFLVPTALKIYFGVLFRMFCADIIEFSKVQMSYQ